MQPPNLRILNRPRPGSRPAQVTKLDALPVKVGELEEPSPALRGPVRRVCLVCKANNSAYACPRCSTPYCSSACYKSHGEKCTEQFFRHHVEAEMRLREAERKEEGGGEDRRTVVRALRKWKGGEGSVGEEYLSDNRPQEELDEDRLELLAKLGEGGALGLEMLSEEERRRFLADVASGEVGRALQIWKPWWLVPLGAGAAPLVSEVPEAEPSNENGGENGEADLPEGCVTLAPLLQQVQRFDPSRVPGVDRGSPLLRYHILDVLLAYAHVARVYNGCWRDEPLQACEDLLSLSSVLGPRPCPLHSAAEALTSASIALQTLHPHASIPPLVSALAKDALLMLAHKVRLQCALVEAFNIVRAAVDELHTPNDAGEADFDVDSLTKEIEALSVKGGKDSGEKKGEKQRSNEPPEGSASQPLGSKKSKAEAKQLARLLKVLHKLRFFLAWVKRQQDGEGGDVWKTLAEEAEAELQVLEQQRSKVIEKKVLDSRSVPQVVPKAAGPPAKATTKRVLIEELDSQPA